MAKILADGSIEFADNRGLLDVKTITREAVKMFFDSMGKTEELEKRLRVDRLRESCGVAPEKRTLKIKMWSND